MLKAREYIVPISVSSKVEDSDLSKLSKSFNVVSVAMFGAENARQVKIGDVLNINLENLEVEIQEQAKEFTWWAQVTAKATEMLGDLKADKDKAEADLKRTYARLSILAKSPQGIRLTNPEEKKPSIADVDNWVLTHPEYIDAQSTAWLVGKQVNEMERTVTVYANMRKGYEMKAKMLECLFIKKGRD